MSRVIFRYRNQSSFIRGETPQVLSNEWDDFVDKRLIREMKNQEQIVKAPPKMKKINLDSLSVEERVALKKMVLNGEKDNIIKMFRDRVFNKKFDFDKR